MTQTRIDIAAITSGLGSAVSELRKEIDAAKDAARDGIQVNLDTSAAEARVVALTEALDAAKAALEAIGTVNIDTDSATRAVTDVSSAAQDAEQAISQINQTHVNLNTDQARRALEDLKTASERALPQQPAGGSTRSKKEAEDAAALVQQLERVRRTKEFMERTTGRPVTDYEATRYDEVFRQRASRNSMLRGFDGGVADWHSGVASRFSNGAAADDHRRGVLDDINGEVFGPGRRSNPYRAMLGRYAGALGGVAGGMIAGGGGMFGNIGAGIGGLAGLIPGLGTVLGPLTGGILGAVGGRVDKGMEDATSTAQDISNLKHSLGEASDSFEGLRDKVQAASEGMGIAYVESARFAKHYAELSNLQRDQKNSLGGELRTAYGFAKGFGLDPQSGVGFMGQMRLTGNVSDEKSAKLMAVHIADAVERGGNRSKMDEVLASISNFAQQSARLSLTAPDVNSFASYMATGTATRVPGLDPANASAILSSADNSMRRGGGYGDASKIAIMSAIANGNSDLSVFDVEAVMEGGLFGNAQKTFGKGGIMHSRAEQMGLKGELSRYDKLASHDNSGVNNATRIMNTLRSQSGSDDEYLASMRGAFGLQSMGQAAALDLMHNTDPGLGGLKSKLSKAGVNIENITGSSLGGIAEVASGDVTTLNQYAGKLRAGTEYKALSDGERKSLDAAKTPEELRDVLLKLLSDRERQETIGDKTLNIQADMRDAFQRMAEGLLPATVTMKDGVLALVERFAPDSKVLQEIKNKEQQESAAVLGSSTKISVSKDRKTLNQLYDRRDAAKTDTDRALIDETIDMFERTTGTRGRHTKPAVGGSKLLNSWAKPEKPKLGGDKVSDFYNENFDAAFAAAKDAGHKDPKHVAYQLLQQSALETGFGKSIIPGTNNLGNVKAGKSWKGGTASATDSMLGTSDKYRAYGSAKESFADMLSLRRFSELYGQSDEALAYGLKDRGYAQDPQYPGKFLNMPDPADYLGKTPETGSKPQDRNQNATVSGSVRVVIDSNGKETAVNAPLKGRWNNSGRPVPAGA